MSDKSVKIRIETAGADTAEGEFKKVSTALNSAGAAAGGIDRAGKKLTDLADAQSKVTKSSFSMRHAMGGVGLQLQDIAVQAEMGTNAVRIVSQQVPQMLGAFGPWGAIAGSIVAIGVPVAASLGLVGKAAKDSAPDVKNLADSYGDLLAVYQDIEKATIKEIKEAATKSQDDMAGKLGGIDRKAQVSIDATNLEVAKQTATANLELARERHQLATLESALVHASGEDAVKLAAARKKIIGEIFDTEILIQEIGRGKDLANAKTKRTQTTETYSERTGEKVKTANAYEAESAKIDALRNQSNELYGPVVERLPAIEKRLGEVQAELQMTGGPGAFGGAMGVNRYGLIAEEKRLKDEQKTIGINAEEGVRLAGDANAKQDTLAVLEGLMKEAAKAQMEAAKAMQAARGEVDKTETEQGIERKTDVGMKKIQMEDDMNPKFTKLAEDTIAKINEAGLNKNPGAGSEVEDGLKKLMSDNVPDAQQGKSIMGLIQQLANSLTQKDQDVIKAIDGIIRAGTSLNAGLIALSARIATLEAAAAQKK